MIVLVRMHDECGAVRVDEIADVNIGHVELALADPIRTDKEIRQIAFFRSLRIDESVPALLVARSLGWLGWLR